MPVLHSFTYASRAKYTNSITVEERELIYFLLVKFVIGYLVLRKNLLVFSLKPKFGLTFKPPAKSGVFNIARIFYSNKHNMK